MPNTKLIEALQYDLADPHERARHIHALRDEAALADDVGLVRICDAALSGDDDAIAECCVALLDRARS